ncbi:MAG: aldehyde ferredoxin oxidoreductase family protein [Candidatus Kariarchaeaceae archaeon]|jgi:aldehyde:ferredoxin oxidoreductase
MTWSGKIARINLTKMSTTIFDTPKKVVKHLIGGKGLGTYFLLKEMDPSKDALDPESSFILATGPAQGILPIAGRYCIVTKSPLSNMFLDSHVGGFLGPEVKFAGFDAIIVTGRAEMLSRIQITDHEIEILNANELARKTVLNTEDSIKEFHDPKAKILSIGPAGENQVRIACTSSDSYRNAARGGIGMMLGSKNLKAISVRGTNGVKHQKTDKIKELISEINNRAKSSRVNKHPLPTYGTSWLVSAANSRSQLPTLNYSQGEWEHASDIEGSALDEHFKGKIKRKPCYKCSLACSFVLDTDYSWTNNRLIQHPEYESLALLGSNLGISDVETIVHLNHLCNIYGLDTISTGSVISWFIESGSRGAVPSKYQSEIIKFGDSEGTKELVRKIAFKEGVGKILSEGVQIASQIFGNESEKWAVHVRGLELPAWLPQGKLALGLSYITSNVGGSHLRGWASTTDYPDRSMLPVIDSLIEQQDLKILKDSLIMCHFTHSISPALNIGDTAKIFETLSGERTDEKSIRKKAQRIWILSRNFNVQAWGNETPRSTDKLPYRLMYEPLPSGPAKGLTSFVSEEDLNLSLDEFYSKRNCHPTGIPMQNELENSLDFTR